MAGSCSSVDDSEYCCICPSYTRYILRRIYSKFYTADVCNSLTGCRGLRGMQQTCTLRANVLHVRLKYQQGWTLQHR